MDRTGGGGNLAMFGPYAGFWRRFGAALIDLVVLWVIGLLIARLFGLDALRFSVFREPLGRVGNAGRLRLLGIAIGWLYFALLESSPARATIGKMFLRISVTAVGSGRVSFARASVRYFAKYL
ncbi:MAG: RDD family protein, partial [Actinomycetota bacterium]|nr:RDD family protein [Actinomycetota bacterium]